MSNEPYVMRGLAIINPYGGIWTPHVFSTPEEAMKYLESFWNGKSDRLKGYRLAVATLTVTLDRVPSEPTFITLPDTPGSMSERKWDQGEHEGCGIDSFRSLRHAYKLNADGKTASCGKCGCPPFSHAPCDYPECRCIERGLNCNADSPANTSGVGK
jgi:hypothetical protein